MEDFVMQGKSHDHDQQEKLSHKWIIQRFKVF